MRYVVLDTNCLLQSLPSRSPYHVIWEDILRGVVSLCVNTEILEEYEEIIAQKTNSAVAVNIVETIARLETTTYQESYIHFGLIQNDIDDNKFVDCAIASNAEFIVTNDKHFEVLKTIPWPKVLVLDINKFLEELIK